MHTVKRVCTLVLTGLLALPMALAGVVAGLWVCLLFFRFRRQLLAR